MVKRERKVVVLEYKDDVTVVETGRFGGRRRGPRQNERTDGSRWTG
ncbi:hypothetical protein ANO14919_011730 [Xylariales sp. No.14919]|nr:hypothetical protein ANO14919_011730 [Xylariales sp. No.14919]